MAALKRFLQTIFWSSSQALEKYLKASLVLNGVSVKNSKHNIVRMFDELVKIAGSLVLDEFSLPKRRKKFFSKMPELWGSNYPKDFIEHVSRNGSTSNRYNTFGVNSEFSDLYKLDQIVFNLRRLSVDLNRVGPENETKTYREILLSGDVNFDFSKTLKRTLSSNRQAYYALKKENYAFFAKSKHSSKYQLISDHRVSELETIFKFGSPENSELRKWIRNNIQISDKDLENLSSSKKA